MDQIVDLEAYPIDRPGTSAWQALVARTQAALAVDGVRDLAGFMRPDAVAACADHAARLMPAQSFYHHRAHNIYFKDRIDGLEPGHPALAQSETIHHTLCHDQLLDTPLDRLYGWSPFAAFLAAVMARPVLHRMDDPLAGINVMEYRDGEALNWHFDRSIFTTTLLLRAPITGGVFEFSKDLRRDTDPNYAGVAALLRGDLVPARLRQAAGTLTIFLGRDTAHRVSTVRGARSRLVSVFSYFDTPGMRFSEAERVGFYGRAT